MNWFWILIGFAAIPVGIGIGLDIAGFSKRRPAPPEEPGKRALAILQERYARGEIDLDEYLQRRGYIQLESGQP